MLVEYKDNEKRDARLHVHIAISKDASGVMRKI